MRKRIAASCLALVVFHTAFAAAYVQTDGTNTTGGITITIAAGDTFEISGKVTGSGRVTTSGSGTLILSCGENDWTGGIKVGKGGTLKVTAEGALGANEVILSEDVSGAAGGTIVFDAPSATFANVITVKRSNSTIRFSANTTLTGTVSIGNNDSKMYADAGVYAVIKGQVSNGTSNTRPLIFDNCKGSIAFEGKITSKVRLTEWQTNGSADGGVAYLCSPNNAFAELIIGSMAYVCSNENVIASTAIISRNPKYDSSTGCFDLNGFDQTIKGLSIGSCSALGSSSNKENVRSAEPATLTLKGNGAGTVLTNNFAVMGQVSVVVDSAATATNLFLNRVNGTSGDITVSSGCLRLTGGTAAFTNVASVTVGTDGAFLCDSTAAHPLPDGIALTLAEGAAFALPAAVSVTVSSFTVGGVRKERGIYTSANCPEIRSGSVVVGADGTKSVVWTGAGSDDFVSTGANWSDPELDLGSHDMLATFASGGTRAVIDRDVYFTGLTMNALDFTFAPGGGRMFVLSNNLAFAALEGTPARTNIFDAPMVLSGNLSVATPAKTVVKMACEVSAPAGAAAGTINLIASETGSSIRLAGVTIEQNVYVRLEGGRSDALLSVANTTNLIKGQLSVANASSQYLILRSGSELVVEGGIDAPNGCLFFGGGYLIVTNSPFVCNNASKTVQISGNTDYGGTPTLVFAVPNNNINLICTGYGGTIDCRVSDAFTGNRNLSMDARWNGTSVLKLHSTTQAWQTVTILKESTGLVRIMGGPGATIRVTGSGASSISATSGKVAVSGELSIIKSGSGTLTISNCSFDSPGTFEVSGGTLALSQGMLDSESVLRLSGSGVISVADGERQKFSAVYVGDTRVSAGTYSYANAPEILKAHMANTTGRIRIPGAGIVVTFR